MQSVALSPSPKVSTYQTLHDAFHGVILEAAGNGRLTTIAKRLHKPVALISRQSLSRTSHLIESCRYHAEIADAIADEDGENAIRLTHEHVMVALDEVMSILAQETDGDGRNE